MNPNRLASYRDVGAVLHQKCGRTNLTRPVTATKLKKRSLRIARGRPGGPQIPLDPDEFLNRLKDRDTIIWAFELRDFVGWRKWQTMKAHLVRAGIVSANRDLHGFRMPVRDIISKLVPHFAKRRDESAAF